MPNAPDYIYIYITRAIEVRMTSKNLGVHLAISSCQPWLSRHHYYTPVPVIPTGIRACFVCIGQACDGFVGNLLCQVLH